MTMEGVDSIAGSVRYSVSLLFEPMIDSGTTAIDVHFYSVLLLLLLHYTCLTASFLDNQKDKTTLDFKEHKNALKTH